MADQDHHLSEVQSLARGLARDREEVGESREELTESLAELHREPRANLEVTENEGQILRWALGQGLARGVIASPFGREAARSLLDKTNQMMSVESQTGGKFYRGGAA